MQTTMNSFGFQLNVEEFSNAPEEIMGITFDYSFDINEISALKDLRVLFATPEAIIKTICDYGVYP